MRYLILFTMSFLFSVSAGAQVVLSTNNNMVKIDNKENAPLHPGQKVYVLDSKGRRAAIVQVTDSSMYQVTGKILKGKVYGGWKVQVPASKKLASQKGKSQRRPSSYDRAQSKTQESGKSYYISAAAFYFTGNASVASSSTTTAISTADYSADASGFSLAPEFGYRFGDFTAGGEYRYSSLSLSSGEQKLKGSTHDVGVVGGYILNSLKMKINLGLYLFGSAAASANSSKSSSGYKVGAQYSLLPQMGIVGEYRSMNYSGATAGEDSTTTMDISYSSFNIGGYFSF